MRKLLLQATVGVTLLMGTAAPTWAFSASQRPPHQFFQVDDKRFLDSDIWLTNTGAIHVHLKVSNGWRLDPMHVRANLIFYDAANREIYRVSGHVWCKASLGGHGQESAYDFNVPRGDVWSSAVKVVLVGSYEPPPAPRNPNEPSAPSIPVFTF